MIFLRGCTIVGASLLFRLSSRPQPITLLRNVAEWKNVSNFHAGAGSRFALRYLSSIYHNEFELRSIWLIESSFHSEVISFSILSRSHIWSYVEALDTFQSHHMNFNLSWTSLYQHQELAQIWMIAYGETANQSKHPRQCIST